MFGQQKPRLRLAIKSLKTKLFYFAFGALAIRTVAHMEPAVKPVQTALSNAFTSIANTGTLCFSTIEFF